ncbi:MAG: presenilin family intramembrane aspartyl protease [Candidatus Micrarchaeia archaeon]
MFRRIEARQLVHILIIFMLVQFGGLLVSSLVFTTTPLTLAVGSAVNTPMEAIWFFIYIIVTAIIILLVFRIYHGEALFVLMEAFVVIASSFFVFIVVISYLVPNAGVNFVYAIALLAAVAMIIAKNKRKSLTNFVAIIASIGVGLILGLDFSFGIAYLLVALIAIYDYVAVFVTKHMIMLAKALSSRNLAFLVSTSDIEVMPKNYLNKKEAKEYAQYKKEIAKINSPVIRKLIKSGKLPLVSQVQLGAGDLGIPLMLAISSYKIFFSYFTSLFVIIGGIFGLAFTMHLLKKYMVPLPAIPPLFSFMSIFIGVYFIPIELQFSALFIGLGIVMLLLLLSKLRR